MGSVSLKIHSFASGFTWQNAPPAAFPLLLGGGVGMGCVAASIKRASSSSAGRGSKDERYANAVGDSAVKLKWAAQEVVVLVCKKKAHLLI